MLPTRFGFGFWVLGFGFWVLGFGFWVLGFAFNPLCAASISRKEAEVYASTVRVPQGGAGCAPRQVELRSPACLRLIEGTPQGWQTGDDFFWLLFLARQEK